MPSLGQLDAARIAALDAQIAQAKADGLKVILTSYRFPTWANGTDRLTDAQLAATMPDRRTSTESDAKAKTLLFRYPDDVSAPSAWGQWIALLVARYSANSRTRPNSRAVIDFLELCNEPNLQWWPQQVPSTTGDPYAQGTIVVHDVVVRMFQTAAAITAPYGSAPGLMGPGTAGAPPAWARGRPTVPTPIGSRPATRASSTGCSTRSGRRASPPGRRS